MTTANFGTARRGHPFITSLGDGRFLVCRLSEGGDSYRWCWVILRATSAEDLNDQFIEAAGWTAESPARSVSTPPTLAELHLLLARVTTERLMSSCPPGALGGRKRTIIVPEKPSRVWGALGEAAGQTRDFLSKGGFHVVTMPSRNKPRRFAMPLSSFSRSLLMDRIESELAGSDFTLEDLQRAVTRRGRPRKETTDDRRELERVVAALRSSPRSVPVHRLAEVFGCSTSTISTLANRGAKSEAISPKKGNASCDIALGLTSRVGFSVYRMPTRINPSDSPFKASDDAAAA